MESFHLQRQVCFHILAPFHAEKLKPSSRQVFVEVTLGVDIDVKLFGSHLQVNKEPHILLKFEEQFMNF